MFSPNLQNLPVGIGTSSMLQENVERSVVQGHNTNKTDRCSHRPRAIHQG